MERKFVIEDHKSRLKYIEDGKSLDLKLARSSNYCYGSSRSVSSVEQNSKSTCGHRVTEFLCSCCLLCICCPLAVVWCCIKLPCKLGWRAARHAKHWASCRSQKKIFAVYSSFSDNDSD